MDNKTYSLYNIAMNKFFLVILILIRSHSVCLVVAQTFQKPGENLQTVSEASIPSDSVHVDLSYNKITRLYDGDFIQLSQLQNLYLVDNQLATIDNGAFRGLVSLQRLYLQENSIVNFPDLSQLTELRELNLQNNDIINLPDNVYIPTDNKVERLDLSQNKFTSVPNAFLRYFKALKYLNVCCGNLEAPPPVYELAGSLQILDLRSSKISALQSQSFSDGSTQSSMRELILEDNTCTVENGLFQNLPNLQVLNINKLGLTDLPDLTMNIANLQELYISNNSLTTITPEKLFGNPPDYSKPMALTILNAAHNVIESVESRIFTSMRNLKTLNLGSNRLQSFPLDSLVESSELELLNLESNQIETLMDWDVTGRTNLNIDITDNPLDCSTLCWFVQSGYASFDENRLQQVTSPQACAKPQAMTSFTWQQITSSPELLCNIQPSTTTTLPNIASTTTPDTSTDGADKTKDGDDEDEGSSNKLEIIIGVAVAVFVVAGIVAVVSVLKFCVWGKKEPDVILIGKMETGLSQKKKRQSVGKQPNGEKPSGDKDDIRRDKRSSKGHDKHSRHSKSPRNSRLHTISEKSEDIDNNHSKNRNKRKESERRRESEDKNDRRKEGSGDHIASQEIPFEYTYRV